MKHHMKVIVVGLGNFGGSLGVALMEKGAEVIGVDIRMHKVDLYKDKLTYTICLDTTDELALSALPLNDCDYIVVSIGEDIGASITSTALMKKHSKGNVIGRAISPIHETILETMGVKKIIHPEASFAKELANQLCLKGAFKTMLLDKQFEIAEVPLPSKFVGKSIMNGNFRKTYSLNIITILREGEITLLGGKKSVDHCVMGVVSPETELKKNDILVLFGKNKDIEAFVEKYAE